MADADRPFEGYVANDDTLVVFARLRAKLWLAAIVISCQLAFVSTGTGRRGVLFVGGIYVALAVVAYVIRRRADSVRSIAIERHAFVFFTRCAGRSELVGTRIEFPQIEHIVIAERAYAAAWIRVKLRSGLEHEFKFVSEGRRPSTIFEVAVNRTAKDLPRGLLHASANVRAVGEVLADLGVEIKAEQVETYPRLKYWK